MSSSVLYLGKAGPLFEGLKSNSDEGSAVSLTCLDPEGSSARGSVSAEGIGLDPETLRGHSLLIVGRGARISPRALLDGVKVAQVPTLIISEGEAEILDLAGESAGVPILVAGGPFPGLGLLLMGMLLRGGAKGEAGALGYGLEGISPFWSEYLRGTFGRQRGRGAGHGAAQGLPGEGTLVASGEVGAMGAFGADIGGGRLMPFPMSARLISASRRLSLGLRALDTPMGEGILGSPGGVPDPEAFLTGQGGRMLSNIAPEGEGGSLSVTLRSRYRTQRAALEIMDPQALAGACVGALGRILLGWGAPIGLSSPLSPAVFPAFEAAMSPALGGGLHIEDLPHTLDPRSARRFQILAP